ncbi:MAG TPA: DUF1549 and DUF1553 domain-containing protein [Methylomirabilota bacterium]|nr:DUF1549 and DUF1553 domain-containing protein [Methylomirabilota bacterium]
MKFSRNILALISCVAVWPGRAAEDAPVSFRNDVVPVLSKAGCSAGTCHGNKYGKGGFKLSLRSQDPDLDLLALTRDAGARRVNGMEPEHSLVLLKPLTQVPHEGGARFKKDSAEYRIIRDWIAQGCRDDVETAPKLQRIEVTPLAQVLTDPKREVQLTAQAFFSDGGARDITSLAVYEPSTTLVQVSHDGLAQSDGNGEATVIVRFLDQQQPVRLAFIPSRPNFKWSNPRENNYIDKQVFAKLRSLRMTPSEPGTDTVFMRRAYLDLLGVLPSAEEAQAFVAEKRKDKRARLIDQLLDRPEFAEFWALKWADLFRNEEKTIDRKGVQAFHGWIAQSLRENKPVDQFVREIIAARGSTYLNPPANYYRALRDPVTRAEATAQVFLGVRLQCAQCHNHPFDRWSQDDYSDWASIFARVDYKILQNNRRDGLDKHEFNGEQIVFLAREGNVTNARNGKPASARFLGAPSKLAKDEDPLRELANWVTANPLFAKSHVNRVWFHLMGRGLVDPIDDFRPTNPPSHPELLDQLAKDFAAQKFDLRWLIRFVMNSRAYQLSSEPNDTNAEDELNFSHVLPRRLTAEQLLDGQHTALDVPARFTGYPRGMRAGQLPGVEAVRLRERRRSSSDTFLTLFGKPMRLLSCECERSSETTMSQAFNLVSGPEINGLLSSPDNRIHQMMTAGKSNQEIISDLYWWTLSRPPTQAESLEMLARADKAENRGKTFEDIAWALLNAKEFVFRP